MYNKISAAIIRQQDRLCLLFTIRKLILKTPSMQDVVISEFTKISQSCYQTSSSNIDATSQVFEMLMNSVENFSQSEANMRKQSKNPEVVHEAASYQVNYKKKLRNKCHEKFVSGSNKNM